MMLRSGEKLCGKWSPGILLKSRYEIGIFGGACALCGFLMALLTPLPVLAESLEERLRVFQTLTGDFRQQLRSAEGELLQEHSGSFSLRQPGKFRWHIQEPDEQLLLLVDGELLHYDVELATATLNPSGGVTATPLAILGGETAAIQSFYQVEEKSEGAFALRPLDDSSPLTLIHLHFAGNTLVSMNFQDRLLQTTEIEFSSVRINPPLPKSEFAFVIPEGVDYFRNEP
ncbi:MAG: outer-membrane lipoprotein carrier protein LolA [Halieaceae bacterium]|nr:outer-membrane lipoprotein carrier protein LolA [Halieaceae bacterium]